MWDKSYLETLDAYRSRAALGGGQDKIDAQHRKGKLTARERLDILFDKDTFVETDAFMVSRIDDFGADKKRALGDGVVTGYGKIDGRPAFAASEDFTVIGGTLGESHAKKICKVMDMALSMRAPMIMLCDSGGARIEEGITSLSGYAEIFLRNTRASGVIPQISVIMGPCAGGACYSPAITDFIFMVRDTGLMFITGPQVVKEVTREEITPQELGGADMHTNQSGVAHFCYNDDMECLNGVRELLSYLPSCAGDAIPVRQGKPMNLCRALQEVVTDKRSKCYDMRTVIGAMVDDNNYFEVHAEFAKNITVGFARMDGKTVAFVANQPNYMAGSLDCDASDKAARFVRFCDCYNIPIITLVDVPAFLPGKQQEQMGIIRHGAKLLYAYAEATVPKITVILRKAYGGAYIAMNSKEIGANIVYAWPTAEIAVMGAASAVDIIYKNEIKNAPDPALARLAYVKEYESKFMNPYIAAGRGYVDEVIAPEETRDKIIVALSMLTDRPLKERFKHGNIPL